MELISQSEDRPMQLRVWNFKSQTTRELQLTPSRKWPVKRLLRVTIRFDSYEAKSSPAERTGLRAGSYYVLGTPERVFTDAEDLHDEILDALDGSFQCYDLAETTIFNSSLLDDQVRIVSIVPTERWCFRRRGWTWLPSSIAVNVPVYSGFLGGFCQTPKGC
ncbi:hypothetical protein PsorP6_005033 [Peronosclerospora sorghi]|uniref:Uncharacterized protein n=1 Tax=Peronosclerospora sorghi TaxID=230839 RepID=A0ACC0W394_9STRA|nr:hypothetical protein PsorP6_005033 [Peronosclerospora sorghi]